MKKLRNRLMLSCKKATELIEKNKITALGLIESIQLKFHKKICKTCRVYEVQSNIIDEAVKNQNVYQNDFAPLKMSDEAKKKMLNKLAEQSK